MALPWYVLCAKRNPDFLRIFIFQHNFQRYLTPVFQHKQPFWFFGWITLLAILPWTVLLIPAAREGLRLWREKSWVDSPGFFFACWAVFPIIFFSASQSKLPGYILPAIPALALLCAVGGMRAFQKSRLTSVLVAAGFGCTLLPALAAQPLQGPEASFVVRPLKSAKASRRVGLVWRKGYPKAHELGLLAALIRDNPPSGTRTVLMNAKSVVRSAANPL